MRLEAIEISNFKGLRQAEYAPRSFTCLVGENNAGKSSILQTVVYALNRPTELPRNVFYNEAQPITLKCSFDDIKEADLLRLAEEHREKIRPLVYDGRFSLVVRFHCGDKVDLKVIKKTPLEGRLQDQEINEILKGKRGGAILRAFEESYPEWAEDLPEGCNLGQAKEYLASCIQELPDDYFGFDEAPLPSGISSSIKSFLPEPIYIPAVKNINDDLKTTQSTSFGRLLGLLLEELSPDLENINESLANLRRMLNRVVEGGVEIDERHEKVKELELLVEKFLGENFPRVRVELEVPPPELKTILNTAQIYVDDGTRDLIDHKGDGIKRSLTFALLRAYVHQLEQRRAAAQEEEVVNQPLVFLFEEPELYLHPKSQRIFFDTLESISRSYQVMVTTHSPIFFSPGVTAKFIRVSKKDEDPKPIGKLFPVDFELDAESAETFRLAKFEHAEAGFFASKVVLFEGESDDLFLSHVAKTLNSDWDFSRENIAMVRVGGKGNFSRFRRFFELFGIEVLVITDLDALFDGYHHLGASKNCTNIRNFVLQEIDERINALGIKADLNSQQIKKKITKDSWRDRYEAAKSALQQAQGGAPIDDALLNNLDALFVWENSDARFKAVVGDAAARLAVLPLLDALRGEGISVLSRGAIEDYYPDPVPKDAPKPDRAMHAVQLLPDRDSVVAACPPMSDGRPPEFEEVFGRVFGGGG